MTDRPGQWRRSSRCEAHNCVEVAITPGQVLARDSASPDGAVLRIDRAAWQTFCVAVREGRLRR